MPEQQNGPERTDLPERPETTDNGACSSTVLTKTEIRSRYEELQRVLKGKQRKNRKNFVIPSILFRDNPVNPKIKFFPWRLVKVYREELGLTQTELANAIGISQGALCKMEKGDRRITTVMWGRIKKVLGVPDSYEELGDAYEQAKLVAEQTEKYARQVKARAPGTLKKRQKITLTMEEIDELEDLKNGNLRYRLNVGARASGVNRKSGQRRPNGVPGRD